MPNRQMEEGARVELWEWDGRLFRQHIPPDPSAKQVTFIRADALTPVLEKLDDESLGYEATVLEVRGLLHNLVGDSE